MAKYNLEKQVPWDKVMEIMSWHLKMRAGFYEREYEYLKDGSLEQKAKEASLCDLLDSFEAYTALRAFLSYTHKTKIQLHAQELIKSAEEQGAIAVTKQSGDFFGGDWYNKSGNQTKKGEGTNMLVDLTVLVTPQMSTDAQESEKKALAGHLGTHFDVMDKEFPLQFVERKAVVFDVSNIKDRDITAADIQIELIEKDVFAAFYTGFIEQEGYGTQRYFSSHPQLANDLTECLLERGVSIIGLDFAGIRRGREHTPKDQYCADRGVFIIENLCNLQAVLKGKRYAFFTANTYPLSCTGLTGLPCRVVAKTTE